jgi:hypothetical protein
MTTESFNGSEGNIERSEVNNGIEQFNKLKEQLEKLPLPDYYKRIGIASFGDESGGVIDIWQSDFAMQRGDLADKIGRIVINLHEGTVQVGLTNSYQLDHKLTVSSFDFETEGMDKDAVEALLVSKIEKGMRENKNPFGNIAVGRIRDPRIQAIIDYVVTLEKGGFKLDFKEDDYIDRKFAIIVKEEELDLLEGQLSEEKALAEAAGTTEIVTQGQSDIVAKADILKTELDHLKKLQAEADKIYEQKNEELRREQAENPPVRNRRSRRASNEDQPE